MNTMQMTISKDSLHWLLVGTTMLLLALPGGFASATHDYCGNTDTPQSLVSGGNDGYGQSSYYGQTTYYSQPTYYLQGGYWPPINDISLTVTPKVVRVGEQVTIVWNGGNASACTVTGAGINSTSITGSQVVTISGEAVVEAQCNLGPNISRASTTIKVLPRIQESFNDSFDHFKNRLSSVIQTLLWS
jgi:hypothetical protein